MEINAALILRVVTFQTIDGEGFRELRLTFCFLQYIKLPQILEVFIKLSERR